MPLGTVRQPLVAAVLRRNFSSERQLFFSLDAFADDIQGKRQLRAARFFPSTTVRLFVCHYFTNVWLCKLTSFLSSTSEHHLQCAYYDFLLRFDCTGLPSAIALKHLR
jgi:hypothetical protein